MSGSNKDKNIGMQVLRVLGPIFAVPTQDSKGENSSFTKGAS